MIDLAEFLKLQDTAEKVSGIPYVSIKNVGDSVTFTILTNPAFYTMHYCISTNTSYRCLQDLNKECPVCAYNNENYNLFNKSKFPRNKRFLFNVWNHNEHKVNLFECGIETYGEIVDALKKANGSNIAFKYKKVQPKKYVLAVDSTAIPQKDVASHLLYNLEEIIEKKSVSDEELTKKFNIGKVISTDNDLPF